MATTNRRPFYKKGGFWVLIVLLAASVTVGLLIENGVIDYKPATSSEQSTGNDTPPQTTTKPPATTTSAPANLNGPVDVNPADFKPALTGCEGTTKRVVCGYASSASGSLPFGEPGVNNELNDQSGKRVHAIREATERSAGVDITDTRTWRWMLTSNQQLIQEAGLGETLPCYKGRSNQGIACVETGTAPFDSTALYWKLYCEWQTAEKKAANCYPQTETLPELGQASHGGINVLTRNGEIVYATTGASMLRHAKASTLPKNAMVCSADLGHGGVRPAHVCKDFAGEAAANGQQPTSPAAPTIGADGRLPLETLFSGCRLDNTSVIPVAYCTFKDGVRRPAETPEGPWAELTASTQEVLLAYNGQTVYAVNSGGTVILTVKPTEVKGASIIGTCDSGGLASPEVTCGAPE